MTSNLSQHQTVNAAVLVGLMIAFAGPPAVALVARWLETVAFSLSHVISLVAIAGLVAALLAIVLCWEQQQLSSIGLVPPSMASIIWGLVITAAYYVLIGPLAMRLPGWLGLEGFEAGLSRVSEIPMWLLALTIVIVGAAEEILYRGYAFERLSAATGSLWVSGAITTILFALAHVPIWGWGASLTLLFSSGIGMVLYAYLRDLTPFILSHVLVDMAGLLLPRI